MIKFTIKEMAPMIGSLNAVLSLPLPATESYRLGIAAKQIQERLQIYEQARHKLVTKYGEKIEAENIVRVKPENNDVFSKEIEGLLSEVVEVNMNPISISLLGNSKISPIDLINLSPFFYDSKEE